MGLPMIREFVCSWVGGSIHSSLSHFFVPVDGGPAIVLVMVVSCPPLYRPHPEILQRPTNNTIGNILC